MSITCPQTIDFATAVSSISRSVNTVVDIGSGLRPQTLVDAKLTVCCEPHKGYAARLIERCDNGENICVLNFDWETVVELLPPKSVDTVTLVNVLQHLEKSKGQELLRKTERLAKVQIIVVTTPNPNGASELEPGNDLIDHDSNLMRLRSNWSESDFDASWQVIRPDSELWFDPSQNSSTTVFCALKDIEAASPPVTAAGDEILHKVLGLIGAVEPTLCLEDASQIRRLLELVSNGKSESGNDLALIESLLEQNNRRSKYITHARRGIADLRRLLSEQTEYSETCEQRLKHLEDELKTEMSRSAAELGMTRELLRRRDDLITDLTYQHLTLSATTRQKNLEILELNKHLQAIKSGLTWRLASLLARIVRKVKGGA